MKRTIILFLIMIGLAGVVYSQSPSNIGTESILNRIFDSTNNALQVTLSGDLEMGTNSIDGDSSAGLAFDPDNDNVNEITMEADGDLLLDVGELILENDERVTNSTNGRVCFEGVGQTNNEDICFDLETTANEVQILSTTGALMQFAADILLENNEIIDNGTNGRICFQGAGQTNNEDICFDLETTANGVAITTTTGVTDLTTALNIVTTGELQGLVDVTADTAATIVLTVGDCDGAIRINADTDVIDYTLPAASSGLNCVFYSAVPNVVTIDPNSTSDTIMLNGTLLAVGNAIDSPGASGDFILLAVSEDGVTWLSLGRSGTWVDGGAD